jgi:hypothetical protein
VKKRNRKPCFHGCPTERETHFQCVAYNEDGRLCRQPAVSLDPQRGGFVCERHKEALVTELTLQTTESKICPS